MRTSPTELVNAVFDIAATRGLDAASIREVANAAGVSIGAVQHHFGTKDDLYTFAFEQLVERVRSRVARIDPADPLNERLVIALSQLLPLDGQREHEARVMLSFAARAATSEALASIQRRTLTELRDELTDQLSADGIDMPDVRATLLLAAVDGLTLDAVSSGMYTTAELSAALRTQIRLVLGNA
jgi:AcrR family transcriptional regulator